MLFRRPYLTGRATIGRLELPPGEGRFVWNPVSKSAKPEGTEKFDDTVVRGSNRPIKPTHHPVSKSGNQKKIEIEVVDRIWIDPPAYNQLTTLKGSRRGCNGDGGALA